MIERALEALSDVDVIVFEPWAASAEAKVSHSKDVPKMTAGRAALVGLMRRYLDGFMDFSVSLLEVHKLMYFLQEVGEPLRLRYVKAIYGPYAENLRHVLHAIEGHLIAGYADGGDRPDKPLTLVPGAVHEAEAFIESEPGLRERFDRVKKLVEGFETPFGLELLSTVHWVVAHEKVKDERSIVDSIYAWGDRKHQFTVRQIGLAIERLRTEGFLTDQMA
jgi:hypothetical protein